MVDTKKVEFRGREAADGKRGRPEQKYFDTKTYCRYPKVGSIYREIIRFNLTQGREKLRNANVTLRRYSNNYVYSEKRCINILKLQIITNQEQK